LEIFGVGLPEMLVIAIVALIVLGPDRLPEAARTLGKGVADFRRAIEPARNAWAEVSREISAVTTVAGEATGNPWTVHPIAEGLSPEERDRFFATGEIPEWKRTELAQLDAVHSNGSSDVPPGDPADLAYPMPHSTLAGEPTAPLGELEDLDYPEPPRIEPVPSENDPGAQAAGSQQ